MSKFVLHKRRIIHTFQHLNVIVIGITPSKRLCWFTIWPLLDLRLLNKLSLLKCLVFFFIIIHENQRQH